MREDAESQASPRYVLIPTTNRAEYPAAGSPLGVVISADRLSAKMPSEAFNVGFLPLLA
jgi:hypothetical protein